MVYNAFKQQYKINEKMRYKTKFCQQIFIKPNSAILFYAEALKEFKKLTISAD